MFDGKGLVITAEHSEKEDRAICERTPGIIKDLNLEREKGEARYKLKKIFFCFY